MNFLDTDHVILLVMGIAVGLVLTWIFEFILKTNKKLRKKYYEHHKLFWGYHIHHSMYGIALIVLNIVLFLMDKRSTDFLYTAVGVGIIIMHTFSDGKFVFIEKQRKN